MLYTIDPPARRYQQGQAALSPDQSTAEKKIYDQQLMQLDLEDSALSSKQQMDKAYAALKKKVDIFY